MESRSPNLTGKVRFLISTRHYVWHSEKLVYWLLGVLFAIASLLKPHMAIGLPAVIVYHIICNNHDLKLSKTLINRCVVTSFFVLLGFLSTLAMPFLWVWHIGAIQPFWEIFSSFTPLYSQLSSNVELMEDFPRIKYSVQLYLAFSGFRMLAIGSLLGVLYVWIEKSSPTTRKRAIALFSFTILYSIYVAIGGKFWRYHWMPYIYFASLCTALILLPSHSSHQRSIKPLFSLFAFGLISVLSIQPSIIRYPYVYAKYPSDFIQRVDEISIYLTDNLSPTDTVQPLEWSGGAMYSMLRSQAVIATPYVTDFQFYHHISNPYIQRLRKDFIEKMYENKPTIILDIQEKAKVSGIDTSYHFPELEQFIKKYYQKDYVGDGFEAFRRIDSI